MVRVQPVEIPVRSPLGQQLAARVDVGSVNPLRRIDLKDSLSEDARLDLEHRSRRRLNQYSFFAFHLHRLIFLISKTLKASPRQRISLIILLFILPRYLRPVEGILSVLPAKDSTMLDPLTSNFYFSKGQAYYSQSKDDHIVLL